jgi:HK97 family phage prohead protease
MTTLTSGVEIKALHADVKAVASDNPNGEFEAILSTDALDRDGESIAAGAFDPLPKSIPIYHVHDWREGAMPVGKAEPYYDGTVLKAKGTFAGTARAQEMRSLVVDGIVDSMSVGFINPTRKTLDGKKTVTKGELIEASFTAIPVNATALVASAKSAEVKAGARNSKSDLEHIQAAHDAMVALGAACGDKSHHADDTETKGVDEIEPETEVALDEQPAVTEESSKSVADPAAADAAAEPATEESVDEIDLTGRLLVIDALTAAAS